MFNGWTIFEKLFLILVTIAAFVFTFLFKRTWIDLGYALELLMVQ